MLLHLGPAAVRVRAGVPHTRCLCGGCPGAPTAVTLLLKSWSSGQQHLRHPEACEKCSLRPHPGPAESEFAFDTVLHRHIKVEHLCSKDAVDTGGVTGAPPGWRFSALAAPSNHLGSF